jgi:hypothetical protein
MILPLGTCIKLNNHSAPQTIAIVRICPTLFLGGKCGKEGKQRARLIIDDVCTTQRFSADFSKGIHTALSSKAGHSYLTYLVIFVDALIGQYDGPPLMPCEHIWAKVCSD